MTGAERRRRRKALLQRSWAIGWTVVAVHLGSKAYYPRTM